MALEPAAVGLRMPIKTGIISSPYGTAQRHCAFPPNIGVKLVFLHSTLTPLRICEGELLQNLIEGFPSDCQDTARPAETLCVDQIGT